MGKPFDNPEFDAAIKLMCNKENFEQELKARLAENVSNARLAVILMMMQIRMIKIMSCQCINITLRQKIKRETCAGALC